MSKMRSYGAARGLYSFLASIAWSMIGIGVFAAVISIGNTSPNIPRTLSIAFFFASSALAIFGLFLLASIQNGRAGVDTAEYTQQMLKIARDQLAVSREHLKVRIASEVSFKAEPDNEDLTKTTGYAPPENKQISEVHTNDPEVEKGTKDGMLEYHGKMIEVKNGTYFLGGSIFSSLERAQAKINKKRK